MSAALAIPGAIRSGQGAEHPGGGSNRAPRDSPSARDVGGASPLSAGLVGGSRGSPAPCVGSPAAIYEAQRNNAYVTSAKKYWSRILHDVNMDAAEFTVGHIQTVRKDTRKSGADAWSTRLHDELRETPFLDLLEACGEDVPIHRIVYFKCNGTVTWERPASKKPSHKLTSECLFGTSPPLSSSPGSARHSFMREGSMPCASESGDKGEASFSGSGVGSGSGSGNASDVEEEGATEWALPEDLWVRVLSHCSVRDLCRAACVSGTLREAAASDRLWNAAHARAFGEHPTSSLPAAAVRRSVRLSEAAVESWRSAPLLERTGGYAHTTALTLAEGQCVSADGDTIRVWSPATGRRIASLKGHNGSEVTVLAADTEAIVSGDNSGTVRRWDMNVLKPVRAFRGHAGGVTGVGMIADTTVSGSLDALLCMWHDASAAPVVSVDTGAPVFGLALQAETAHLAAAAWSVGVYDVGTCQLLARLEATCAPHGIECGGLDDDPFRAAHGDADDPFRKVAFGERGILGAARAGEVVLWDLRAGNQVASVPAPGGASAEPLGLRLDGWKMLSAYDDGGGGGGGGGAVHVYDVRCAGGSLARAASGWRAPVMSFRARAPVTCFDGCGPWVVAGLEGGSDCQVWGLGTAETLGAVELEAEEPGTPGGSDDRKKKKKTKNKMPKPNRRYPKRQGK